jgi:hypothetical protein
MSRKYRRWLKSPGVKKRRISRLNTTLVSPHAVSQERRVEDIKISHFNHFFSIYNKNIQYLFYFNFINQAFSDHELFFYVFYRSWFLYGFVMRMKFLNSWNVLLSQNPLPEIKHSRFNPNPSNVIKSKLVRQEYLIISTNQHESKELCFIWCYIILYKKARWVGLVSTSPSWNDKFGSYPFFNSYEYIKVCTCCVVCNFMCLLFA